MEYYSNNNFNYQNDYYYQLVQAQNREKRALRNNVSKMGALLLIYYLLTNLFVYVYYFMVYAYYNHQLSLDTNTVLSYLRGQRELINSSQFLMLGNLFAVFFSLVITMLIAEGLMKIELSEMLTPRKGSARQAVRWFPVAMMINLVMSIIVNYITLLFDSNGITIPEIDFSITDRTLLTFVLQICYVIIIGPIAEEIIFRGIVLTLLKPYGKWMAVFFSSLLFGLMHGNLPQAIPAFVGALVYGVIAVQCNSVVPTILIHIMNNAAASYTDFADILGLPKAVYYVFVVLIIPVGLYVLGSRYQDLKIVDEQRGVLPKKKRYLTVFTNVFMILYFLIIIFNIISMFILSNIQ